MSMIEVGFEDNSKKKFVVTEDTTVGELIEKILQKMYVQVDAASFGLYDSCTAKSGARVGLLLATLYFLLLLFQTIF
jgi:hypothetical protein